MMLVFTDLLVPGCCRSSESSCSILTAISAIFPMMHVRHEQRHKQRHGANGVSDSDDFRSLAFKAGTR